MSAGSMVPQSHVACVSGNQPRVMPGGITVEWPDLEPLAGGSGGLAGKGLSVASGCAQSLEPSAGGLMVAAPEVAQRRWGAGGNVATGRAAQDDIVREWPLLEPLEAARAGRKRPMNQRREAQLAVAPALSGLAEDAREVPAVRPRVEWADTAALKAMRLAPSPAIRVEADGTQLPEAMADESEPTESESGIDPRVRAALERAREAMKACKVPPRPQGGFVSGDAREKAWIDAGATALAARLPPETRLRIAGGQDAVDQVGGMRQLDVIAGANLRENAGSDGHKLFAAIKWCAFFEAFAEAMQQPAWPVRTPLTWLAVNSEHERATAAGKGSRGGGTVGAHARDMMVFMHNIRLPVEVDKVLLRSAAPPAAPAGGNTDGSAGPLLIEHKCQFEAVARGAQRTPQRWWARSLLLGGVDVALRCADGVRLKIALEEDPTFGIITVVDAVVPTSRSKDGLPIQAFAPAEGLLGPYAWAREHVADMHALGQAFPAWEGPWGAQKDFSKATGVTRFVVGKPKIVVAIRGLLKMEPLCATDDELRALAISGHSMHDTAPDWSATIGEWPSFPFELEEADKAGFSSPQVGLIGNWLRLKGRLHDVRPEGDAARAAATGEGRPAGAPNRRGEQHGRYTRGENREGARTQQLRLRGRLTRIVRAVIEHAVGDVSKWTGLPRGGASKRLLGTV